MNYDGQMDGRRYGPPPIATTGISASLSGFASVAPQDSLTTQASYVYNQSEELLSRVARLMGQLDGTPMTKEGQPATLMPLTTYLSVSHQNLMKVSEVLSALERKLFG